MWFEPGSLRAPSSKCHGHAAVSKTGYTWKVSFECDRRGDTGRANSWKSNIGCGTGNYNLPQNPTTMVSAYDGESITFQCPGASVVGNADYAYYGTEVQILSATVTPPNNGDFPPSNCFDGDLKTFCHSENSLPVPTYPSLDFELAGGVNSISAIVIHNRADCCQDRLAPFYVFVSETPFTQSNEYYLSNIWSHTFYAFGDTTLPIYEIATPGLQARYIKIVHNGQAYLNIAEVKVKSGCNSDYTGLINGMCNWSGNPGKNKCSLNVNPASGDPCPGAYKKLDAKVQCRWQTNCNTSPYPMYGLQNDDSYVPNKLNFWFDITIQPSMPGAPARRFSLGQGHKQEIGEIGASNNWWIGGQYVSSEGNRGASGKNAALKPYRFLDFNTFGVGHPQYNPDHIIRFRPRKGAMFNVPPPNAFVLIPKNSVIGDWELDM